MDKVLCALCKFEDNKRCIKKNSKVKVNKRRNCSMYEEDENKLNAMKRKGKLPPFTRRPDWFWDKKEYVKSQKNQVKVVADVASGDPKYPLTGDLSRFIKSTATDKEEE